MTVPSTTSGPTYLAPGSLLGGRYEISEEVGRGGHSIVYRAHDRELGTPVAVKLLVPPPAVAHLARERMRREVKAVRGLAHTNIVAIHDFLEENGWSCIIMEYVDGPDIAVQVTNRAPLSPGHVMDIGAGVADALAEAHRRGILHRDVKPQNILIDSAGRGRLTDFGSARLDGQATMTQTGGLVGTLLYTAPEIVSGARGDARSDIYSLGVTLHYALTGVLPTQESPHMPPAPAADGFHPRTLCPDLPSWLDDVIARATASSPSLRFPTAAALRTALIERDAVVTMHPEATANQTGRCIVCNGAEPFGAKVCPRCAGGHGADTLVIVEGPRARRKTEGLTDRVRDLFAPNARRTAVEEVTEGHRALFRAPRDAANEIITRLAERGIPTRAVPARQAWRALPLQFYLLLILIVVIGGAAGVVADSALLLGSPLIAGLLAVAANRHLKRPFIRLSKKQSTLSAEAEDTISETFGSLVSGAARDLLADVIRVGSSLSDRASRTGDRETHRAVGALLVQSCDAAVELASLDGNLAVLQSHRGSAGPSAQWIDAISLTERARDGLVQRMLEAMTAMGSARARDIGIEDETGARLDELTQAITEHHRIHLAARREVETLLGEA